MLLLSVSKRTTSSLLEDAPGWAVAQEPQEEGNHVPSGVGPAGGALCPALANEL